MCTQTAVHPSARRTSARLLAALSGVLLVAAAAHAQTRGCGGEDEPPCIDGCDPGLGQDPLIFGSCSVCWAGSLPFMCNSDGRGKEGEPRWDLAGIENLRTGRRCDCGLRSVDGICSNDRRHSLDMIEFRASWRGRALALQRAFNTDIPIGQGLYIGTHNSFNNSADGYILPQHSYSISDQLDFGVRKLDLDCHASPFWDPIYHLVRLSHATSVQHWGMSPWDRPLRHGIEEIKTWMLANPSEILIIRLENRSDDQVGELFREFDTLVGNWLLRTSEAPGGNPALLTPTQMLQMGRRIVLTSSGTEPTIGADRFFTDIVNPHYPNNGVRAFLGRGYGFDADTNTSGAYDPTRLTEFSGDADSADDDVLDGATARLMVEAGVDIVTMDPMGLSLAGLIVQRPPLYESIQSLADGMIWSWSYNQPPVNSLPKAAKAVLVAPHTVRFVSTNTLTEQHQVAALSANGSCWAISSSSGAFASGESLAQSVGAAYHFRAPCSGYQMRRLATEMERNNVSEVWVNYADLQGHNNWDPVTTPDDNSGTCTFDVYVAPNGADANPGSPSQPVRTIARASAIVANFGTIHLAPGTYLEPATVTINRPVTIIGSEAGPAVWDGNNQRRCLDVRSGGNVTLRNLTITRGFTSLSSETGAGVRVQAGATAYMLNCTFSANASSNPQGSGGAISALGTVWMTNCTVSGNTAGAAGAAVYVSGGQLRSWFCTITGNSVSGAGGLGGGVRAINNADLILYGSVISGNAAPADADVSSGQNNHSDGYCIIGQHNSLLGLMPTDISTTNPMLAPLAANGGPTQTHRPLPGSPAIDRVPPGFAGIVGDQRGIARPVDADRDGVVLSDIGAVEVAPAPILQAYVSTSGNDANNGTEGAPLRTIAAAISRVDTGAVIYVLPGTYSEHDLTIAGKSLTITAAGNAPVIIDAAYLGRAMYVETNAALILNGLNITRGNTTGPGGGIWARTGSTLNMSRTSIYDCSASQDGGAIAADGVLNAALCTISGNTSAADGGAISNLGGPSATLASCTITGNAAVTRGALASTPAPVLVSSCIIAGNTAQNAPNLESSEVSSLGYNLFGAVQCPQDNCWQPTDIVNVNALVGPLALNDGATYTQLPLRNSLAIDHGAPAGATGADQRGYPRNLDGDCDGALANDIGSVETGDPYPLEGNALLFNGTSDYVSIPTGSFGLANDFTLEAWVRPTSFDDPTDSTRIISTRSADSEGFGLGQIFGGHLIFTTFGRQDYVTAGVYLAVGRWNHVAVTFDSTNTARFYVDGVLVETIAGADPASVSSARLEIGRNPEFSDPQYWGGYIDEIRIWSVTRTPDEIQSAYRESIATPTTGLLAGYAFNEGMGSTTADASGAGNNATIVGATWASVPLCTPPCRGDFNHDGVVNSQDFFEFLNDFFAGNADFNGNGTTDSQDFFDFLAAFFEGC